MNKLIKSDNFLVSLAGTVNVCADDSFQVLVKDNTLTYAFTAPVQPRSQVSRE